MGDLLLSASASRDNTDDFVDMFPCRFDEVTLPMLGAASFQRGWLASTWFNVHPSDPVALGDIGYVTEDGGFVVVDNIHHYLQAEAGTLSWKAHMRFRSGDKFLENTSAEMIISQSGKSYPRRRHVHFPVSSDLINQITLDFSISPSPPRWKCLCTHTMKISMRCMPGRSCSTTRTRSSPGMASLLPRMS